MSKENIIITRKYTLIPAFSDRKEWLTKVIDYTKTSYEDKISYYTDKMYKEKDSKKKNKIKNKIITLEAQKKEFDDTGIITSTNVNDYTYNLVRMAMKSEANRKNMIIGYVWSELLNHNAQNMELKERNELISELTNYGYRIRGSKKGSLFDKVEIDNPLNGYGMAFSQDLLKKIKNMVNEDHVLDGESSLINYKSDSPFTIAKTVMSFTHEYDSFEELCEHIYDKDCNLYFNIGGNGNATIAKFKINLGANRYKKNKDELICTLLKIYSGEYSYCGSSIGIEKKKIILNLSIKIPKKEIKLDENTVVGVDLGIAVPAMCALNNNMYERLAIGSKEDFLTIRTKIQVQKKRLQGSLKSTRGGHGRKKKLKALNRFHKYEAHFVETYTHYVSKQVVDFAVKHNAKYINIENLKGYDTSKFILRNWSYYKLQQYITYKASKYGIEVRKVNPCYTSQVCSICGNWEPNQRESQSAFECANVDCDSHKKYKYGFNADFNAARNIAMSTLFMEDGEVTENSKEEARKYYGIAEKYEKYQEENEKAKVA